MRTALSVVARWLKETTPRWTTVLLVGWLAAATFVGFTVSAENRCVQRAAGQSDLRAAFNGLYDMFDPEHTSPKANALREDLERDFNLRIEDC